MTQLATRPSKHETLEQWKHLLADQNLNNLPYKIETNERGQLILSPVSKRHSFLQARIMQLLNDYLEHGYAMPEVSILTSAGVRAADVAWASIEHYDAEPEELFTRAPEICVEVWSASNTLEEFEHKRKLYFEAGALEVWTCSRDGEMQFFGIDGELEESGLVRGFPRMVLAKGY